MDKETISTELLDTLVVLEKLKLKRKSLLKQASLLIIIALVIIGLGAYGSNAEWTNFPIFQATIAAGGILLAIAFRPIQQCKNQMDIEEKKLQELESLLKKDNLEYKADVRVSFDDKGEYVVQKNIKLISIK
ncbi:hypothetical protein [Kordia sp.]|uniref:hypothetical protein n=1 Tax=Kordia sp. TaxID=1965332 RepID=UPI003D6B36F4